jgi:hypothetical protein
MLSLRSFVVICATLVLLGMTALAAPISPVPPPNPWDNDLGISPVPPPNPWDNDLGISPVPPPNPWDND